jgi:hypothetical protein
MPKRKNPTDPNLLARAVVEAAIGEPLITKPAKGKNPAAVALGRLGGLKGGKARAKKLSARKLKEIATKAAKARWSKRDR